MTEKDVCERLITEIICNTADILSSLPQSWDTNYNYHIAHND